MKICPVGAQLFHAERQADGYGNIKVLHFCTGCQQNDDDDEGESHYSIS
jgi:hypothetical protein